VATAAEDRLTLSFGLRHVQSGNSTVKHQRVPPVDAQAAAQAVTGPRGLVCPKNNMPATVDTGCTSGNGSVIVA
jgi:hypothetical protein